MNGQVDLLAAARTAMQQLGAENADLRLELALTRASHQTAVDRIAALELEKTNAPAAEKTPEKD